MAFWDKVKEVSAKGLDKAKDLGEQAKLNVQKEREQAKIKAAYAIIGKAFAEDHTDLVKEFCGEQATIIDEAKAAIAKLEEQLAALKAPVEEAVEEIKEDAAEAAESMTEAVTEVKEEAEAAAEAAETIVQ